MYYVFDVCPKCMDKLYERKPMDDEEEWMPISESCCPNCGHRLIEACAGEKKPDSMVYNTTYKIFRTYFSPDGDETNKKRLTEKAINIVMKWGHCSRDAALGKLSTANSLICEGNLCETYVCIHELQDAFIGYKTEPEFPYYFFPRYFFFCPTCEGIPVEKTEDLEDSLSEVRTGIFCEKCNKWVKTYITSRKDIDNTVYHLRVCLKGIESNVKMELLEKLEIYEDWEIKKEVTEERIAVDGLAPNISDILTDLKSNDISYEIAPPYPYEIPVYKKLWTEEDVERLKAMNPGLNVTAEELNVLN